MSEERGKRINFRVSEKEHAAITASAKAAGMKTEPFVRSVLSGVEVRAKPPDEIRTLLGQISGLSSNVNQIARRANALGASPADVTEALTILRAIWDAVEAIRKGDRRGGS